MKTQIRPETVKFGTVTQCGRHWAFVKTENSEVRLYWSNLRLVESAYGGIIFSTGKSPTVRCGDAVAFVPQKEGLWLWALRADYETALAFLQRKSVEEPIDAYPVAFAEPPPMMSKPPTPIINLDQEMAALGSAQLQKWQRRYGNRRAFA